jgi:pimeloyl-ACP methyl ester carboxylesterase
LVRARHTCPQRDAHTATSLRTKPAAAWRGNAGADHARKEAHTAHARSHCRPGNNTGIEIYHEDHGAGQPVVLIHSMGTGEIARYLGRYGSERVTKAVLVSPIPPYLLPAGDHPERGAARPVRGVRPGGPGRRPGLDKGLAGRRGPSPADGQTGKRLPGLIQELQLVVAEGGPHAIAWAHAGEVNTAMLDFLRR